jgi:hypothetical protein
MKTSIAVRWQFEGFHYYINAPKGVEFLKNSHRHLFKCTAKIEVHHADRELEFFIVQRKLKKKFNDGNVSGMSCETIAKEILEYLQKRYGTKRSYCIEVSEDGENSAIVES